MIALNHEEKILYRAIFRARYNVAVTCVVALAPEQDVGDFCCSEFELQHLMEVLLFSKT